MTTSVKVKACCADNIEVKVTVTSDYTKSTEEYALNSGEEVEVYAYDDRIITVKEVDKGGDQVET